MDTAVDVTTPRATELHQVLEQLGERIKPVAFARERTVPVIDAVARVLPDGGMVRGRTMSCQGAAAASMANVVVREALIAGAWMALVDVDTFGVDAAAEMGVPLERVVRVDTGTSQAGALDWIDAMGAAVDGFDIVVTRVPEELHNGRRSAAVRKLSTRVQQRGAVVIVLGHAGALGSDVDVVTERTVWTGLGDGVGYLHRRQVDVALSGRRLPGVRSLSLVFEGSGTQVQISEPVCDVHDVSDVHDDDRQLAG